MSSMELMKKKIKNPSLSRDEGMDSLIGWIDQEETKGVDASGRKQMPSACELLAAAEKKMV